MKGNKIFPQCGFSNTACRILDAIGAPYETVDVLQDDAIRNGVKVFSSWPTIPQLYVDGEFIGGSDIMIGMTSHSPSKIPSSYCFPHAFCLLQIVLLLRNV
jgi:monothiol glutaredoxin